MMSSSSGSTIPTTDGPTSAVDPSLGGTGGTTITAEATTAATAAAAPPSSVQQPMEIDDSTQPSASNPLFVSTTSVSPPGGAVLGKNATATTSTTTTTTSTTTTTRNNNNNTTMMISSTGPAGGGVVGSTMNWEPIRARLLGTNLDETLNAAMELRQGIEIVHTVEFPLMLSALLPAFSTIVTHRTTPNPDPTSIQHRIRNTILEILSRMPSNEVLRPHAPHLVAVSLDILNRDYEDNALLACKIIFDLYKVYRSLPQDYVQPFLDFVVSAYKVLPTAVHRSFALVTLTAGSTSTSTTPTRPTPPGSLSSQPMSVGTSALPTNTIGEVKGDRPPPPPTTTTTMDVPSNSTSTVSTSIAGSTTKEQGALKTEPVPQSTTTTTTTTTTVTNQALAPTTTSTTSQSEETGKTTAPPTASTETTTTTTTPPQPPQQPQRPVPPSDSGTGAISPPGTTITSPTTPAVTTPLHPTQQQQQQQHHRLLPRSNLSFRVLTECPLIVMLMFQLYPKFLKQNIPTLIQVMMEALALRSPAIMTIQRQGGNTIPFDEHAKRQYFSRSRELVAAQAKTLSFLTYLLRGFTNELKPYEDRWASNVVALMSTCPREFVSTRKELLVATRHLLNSDHFRNGFFRHVDSLLDEKVLMGSHHRYSEQTVLRPLGYAALSDLVQHIRAVLTMQQVSKVVSIFSRVLHDGLLPLSTQYTAVRTLLSVVDAAYQNKERNPQIGRDLLVRIFRTLVEKLSALHTVTATSAAAASGDTGTNEAAAVAANTIMGMSDGGTLHEKATAGDYPSPTKTDRRDSITTMSSVHHDPTIMDGKSSPSVESKEEPLKDQKNMVRAIVVGAKTLIWYLNNYRIQREKEKIENAQQPPVGANDEVYSGLSKITHTERALIDKYVVLAFPCLRILQRDGNQDESDQSTSTANHAAGERTVSEQYRDTVTYFAAAFTTLDGHDLRRLLGRRLDVFVDAIKDEPAAIAVPRHLLSANPATSFEFCSMMLKFLVERMDFLFLAQEKNVYFISLKCNGDEYYSITDRMKILREAVEAKTALQDDEMARSSDAYLQLFERILKSLSTYPENERALRPYLKRIVSTCLRSSLEKTDFKADNFCMLLRYVFRSISAGKFEESYRELLPLIPAVLNGLFRALSSTDDRPLRQTLIELVLTIPARLSSLLPHMNLLLRVIILALESTSDDLVNLGLRTLEFWVDNLNPEFLYPELSRQKKVFVSLMEALSTHLRPAPYPYGLLTLRLLGKLGGKNRRVLREPINISDPHTFADFSSQQMGVYLTWPSSNDCAPGQVRVIPDKSSSESKFFVQLPLQRCIEILRSAAMSSDTMTAPASQSTEIVQDRPLTWKDSERLREEEIETLDLFPYCRDVIEETKLDQVKSALQVLRSSLTKIMTVEKGIPRVFETEESVECVQPDVSAALEDKDSFDMQSTASRLATYNSDFHSICLGLMYGCTVADIKENELPFMKGMLTNLYAIVMANEKNIVRVDANGSSLQPTKSTSADNQEEVAEFGNLCEEGLGSLKPFGYFEFIGPLRDSTDPMTMNKALAEFLGEPSATLNSVGLALLGHLLELPGLLRDKEQQQGTVKLISAELDRGSMIFFESLLSALCEKCLSSNWSRRDGLYKAICLMIETLGPTWRGHYEVELIHVALFAIKSVPREMSIAGLKSFQFLVELSSKIYGMPICLQDNDGKEAFVVDLLSLLKKKDDLNVEGNPPEVSSIKSPCDEVLQMLICEMASTKHLSRVAARFIVEQYVFRAMDKKNAKVMFQKHITIIRRVLFSRSLRLLPLMEQVGAVEALSVLVDRLPDLIPLEDQHLLSFLSELLKMASVADGEMTDPNLACSVVDKNGFVIPAQESHLSPKETQPSESAIRASSLFLRRDCVVLVGEVKLFVGEELPPGVQLRVSSIELLRSVIRGHADAFFDAETSTPVGNIRPHVISLLFRSLVSEPMQAVSGAHDALRDVLALSVVTTDGPEGPKSKSRLRKELLQTCIRPVLLNLRDYTRLSICLIRGLSQLLSLLSSWFNKTLGEKLLDHLQKWADPNRIKFQKKWNEGEEPDVAAAIVGLFVLLPHASNFVEALVKTTIKLESCLPSYKSQHVYSPYRKPLARYLNKHSQYTVAFFLQRLKTPLYTELFQDIVRFKQSKNLREYLSGRQCSVSLLNVCFERPLAIIHSEKASNASGPTVSPSSSPKNDEILALHGVQPFPGPQNQKEAALLRELDAKHKKLRILQQEAAKARDNLQSKGGAVGASVTSPEAKAALEEAKKQLKIAKSGADKASRDVTEVKKRYAAEVAQSTPPLSLGTNDPNAARPMTIDSLELQFQGFCLIDTLVENDASYLKEHTDVLRAFRWLWRSKGRYLRMQHEESVPPRFHSESESLASFLVSYSRSSPNDVDLLFELIRIFLQPTTSNFSFVRSFLNETATNGLENPDKEQIIQRFFALMAGESTEDIKALSLQLVVYPMLHASFQNPDCGIEERREPSGSLNPNPNEPDGDEKMRDEKQSDIVLADTREMSFSFVNESIVVKFVSEVLFHGRIPVKCGDRLKVGLLRISDLFLEFVSSRFGGKGDDLIKFCWSLLKSDDASCKYWAYFVVCRYISVLETSQKMILQVYNALLRSHQQEGRNLVRSALDLLVPSLPKRLDKKGLKIAIDSTYQVMFEEGNSVSQLAHVWHIVVNHPLVFFQRRAQLARYMINSLNRLGLPPNSHIENRILAVSIVELVMQWEKGLDGSDRGHEDAMDIDTPTTPSDKKRKRDNASIPQLEKDVKASSRIDSPPEFSSSQGGNLSFEASTQLGHEDAPLLLDQSMVETIVNFLIRLKILLADPKVDTASVAVDAKLDVLLRVIFARWNGAIIRPIYFEKVVSMCKDDDETNGVTIGSGDTGPTSREIQRTSLKGSKNSGTPSKDDDSKKASVGLPDILSACLQIFESLAKKDPENSFLLDNPGQLNSILSACFRYAKIPTEVTIRAKLDLFLGGYLALKVSGKRVDDRVLQPVRVWLERLLVDAELEYRNSSNQAPPEASRNTRLRQPHTVEVRSEECSALFSLRVIKVVSALDPTFCKSFTSSLLGLLGTIVKKHTTQAAAKQKQNGMSYSPEAGTVSVRQMYPTPVSGIIEESGNADKQLQVGISKSGSGKQIYPSKELKEFDRMLRAGVIIFEILANDSLPFVFSPSRKMFLSFLQSVLDISNSVQLLLAAVRVVGNWLVAGTSGPLTSKERNIFLLKISSIDFNGLADVVVQPLVDLVCFYIGELLIVTNASNANRRPTESDELSLSRSLISCLLSANITIRENMLGLFQRNVDGTQREPIDILWQLLHSDFEGLGGRYWVVVFVEILLQTCVAYDEESSPERNSMRNTERKLPAAPTLISDHDDQHDRPQFQESLTAFSNGFDDESSDLANGAQRLRGALRRLSHADGWIGQSLLRTLLPAFWRSVTNDDVRLQLVSAMQSFLSRPFHSQSFKKETEKTDLPTNSIKSLFSAIVLFEPLPMLDVDLLISMAQNYNCWYEVLSILENQYLLLTSSKLSEIGSVRSEKTVLAMRRCYRQLGETSVWMSLTLDSCMLAGSSRAASLDIYGKVDKALEAYSSLIELVESTETAARSYEMDFWEERWVNLQEQEQQLSVVSEYATQVNNEKKMLECAWKERSWDKVRLLCSSPSILAAVESGDPAMKMCETLSAVADGKLGDVENLHAQSSQLCLYKWQFLPKFSAGSGAHAKLLHYFHRLVEIRESGQIMVETNNHANGKTLPDLKNLLIAWRHRLPNDEEDLTVWDEIFMWRAHMFNAITSNFNWSEPATLATVHDRPWTAIRMARVAREQGMRQTALLLLNRLSDRRGMSASDIYFKLQEQILLFNNPDSNLERTGGLNLINTTDMSFFDAPQKSELFRLKAIFLATLRSSSKSNQAYSHSVQICPSHTESWISWGGLCSSLGAMTEKQAEQAKAVGAPENTIEARAASAKKVAQYLAQAMGCYLEAVQIDPNEKSRIHLPKCLWMLTKDGASPGVLCQTLGDRGTKLPAWVWLPWVPQLLTGLCRLEGKALKALLNRVVKAYPQAAYYSLRAFYLERRDVERARGGGTAAGQGASHMGSVAYAEEMMSTLRRSHASLWSSLEAILEELIVKFRPSYEEELLATISALLERAESHAEKQSLPDKKRTEEEDAMVASWSKTLSRIAAKFFKDTDSNNSTSRRDERAKRTADFKVKYKTDFEHDFKVTAGDDPQGLSLGDSKPQFRLAQYIVKLQLWKEKLESQVARTPRSLPLIESSHSLAMFVGDLPDLWPGSCDTRYSGGAERSYGEDDPSARAQSTTSSSAAITRKAALNAALSAATAAAREGIGGEYGGGSAAIEIPGQYCPNSAASADVKPSPELHAKLVRFEPFVQVLRRNDQLIRRCGMIGSDGRTYRFLLQFAIPYWTRTDERTAQTYYVMDHFLRHNVLSARNYLSVQPTAAIPVAQRLRMTPDPESRLSLDDVFRRSCDDVMDKSKSAKPAATFFVEEITKQLKEVVSPDASEEEKASVEKGVRLKVYREVCESMVDNRILLRYLQNAQNGPEAFFLFRRAFVVHLASNSLLQYVFSTCERTPQRFVILQSSGRVLSPDFRVSYSNQGFIEGPEVPFRMTPNIETALGRHHIQGHFLRSMAMIAGAVKDHKEEFDPILRLLMRDDILAWYSKSMAKSDSKTQELERQLIERVSKNVHTIQSRFGDCAPNTNPIKSVSGEAAPAPHDGPPIDQTVHDLFQMATDPERLCMMPASYHPWL